MAIKNNQITDALIQRIKANIIRASKLAKSGHSTSSLSSIHILTYLFFSGTFKTDWNDWANLENDQFVLSKGHASSLLYSIYLDLDLIKAEEFDQYRQFNGKLEGHPTPANGLTKFATGSLGMGVGIACGVCIAQKKEKSKGRVFVLCGDGELAEGSIWESLNFASHYKLNNLIVLVDVNRLGQNGETIDGWNLKKISDKFISFGVETYICEDGHEINNLAQSFGKIENQIYGNNAQQPKAILFKTLKGWSLEGVENLNGYHGKAI